MKSFYGVLLVLALSVACATGGAQTKQTVTVEILQPTHDALAAFQDLELGLFKGNVLPQLTPQFQRQLDEQLAIVFRTHALAARAIRTWQPGQPIPIDVSRLKGDVSSILVLLNTAGLEPTSQLSVKAQVALDAVSSAVRQLGGQ